MHNGTKASRHDIHRAYNEFKYTVKIEQAAQNDQHKTTGGAEQKQHFNFYFKPP